MSLSSAENKAPPRGGATPAAGPLIAHRGASAIAPENTLEALRMAHGMGCGWVEIDAQVCADGTVVLMHDHTVERTTDGAGAVAMMLGEAVRDLTCTDPVTGAASSHRPPLLTDVIALCGELRLGLVLEIKPTWGIDGEDAERVAAVLPPEMPFPLLVTSFSTPVLRAFHVSRPDVPLGLACLKPPRDPARCARELALTAIHSNAAYTLGEDIRRMREAGLQTAVATVDDAHEARRFLDAGIDGVMTDRPDLLKEA